ncbi:hypothetical protein [Cryobacterium sp. M23]|nr:hypothetical protein [Cryobacterium sp. M23]
MAIVVSSLPMGRGRPVDVVVMAVVFVMVVVVMFVMVVMVVDVVVG